jgi:zinc protease
MAKNRAGKPIIFAILISLFCVSVQGQDTDPLPELASKRLLNNLQITVTPTPKFGDDMAIGLIVRYGAAFDPADKGGVANLVSRMLKKSAGDRTNEDLQAELAYLGASLEIQCDWDGFRFVLRGQSSQYERSLLFLYHVVAEAQFNEEEFEAEKKAVLEDLQKPPDPRMRIHNQFEADLFSGTTYGRPLQGTPESVSRIKVGDLRYFYRRFFSPNQASLQIVGNVPPSELLQKASRIWGIWVRKDLIPYTFVPPRKPAGRRILLEDDADSPAAQFIIGSLFPPRQDPVYVNARMAALILQDRLTKLLPTSLVTAGNEGRRLASPFYIQAQAAAEQAVEEIQKIQNAVREMKSTVVSAEELADAQERLIVEFNSRMASADGFCRILLDSELYHLGNIYMALFPDQVRRCNVNGIRQAAMEWILPGGELILIRGPADVLKPGLSLLGTVEDLNPPILESEHEE